MARCLIERLRNPILEHGGTAAPMLPLRETRRDMKEAADEIERLRAMLAPFLKEEDLGRRLYAAVTGRPK